MKLAYTEALDFMKRRSKEPPGSITQLTATPVLDHQAMPRMEHQGWDACSGCQLGRLGGRCLWQPPNAINSLKEQNNKASIIWVSTTLNIPTVVISQYLPVIQC